MKLNSIHLTNYRMHADLEVKFAPGFNVIVGVNGSGKTSLLKGVCEALNGLGHGIFHGFPPLSDTGSTRLQMEQINGRFRFESQYPVIVCTHGEAFESAIKWTWTKPNQVGKTELSGDHPGKGFQKINQLVDTLGVSEPLPLVAFYRANRQWNPPQSNMMQAVTQKHARLDGYAIWWDASLDATGLQIWAVSRCLERYQISSETGKSFDAIQDDELALVNAALSVAVENVKGLRYDMKQKSLLVEWAASPHREPTAFENLSDGQRAVIALVADIARRMCLLNPQLGDQVTANTPGVVLIDELDMHLHPHWQRILTNGLKAAFPSLQFIVASHSPQVLGELQPSEIILLRPEGTTHPQVSYGLDSSRVLEEVMDATARTPEVENALSELFAALERNELPAARTQLAALAERAPGIAELDGARALLKRKEVLGR